MAWAMLTWRTTNLSLILETPVMEMKVVREAKRGKRVHKYNVDANGRCFVQLVDRYSQWKEVKAEEDLKRLVASRHQQQPSSQHRWGSQRQ